MNLQDISDDELLAEVERRRLNTQMILAKVKNKDWYFIYDEDDSDPDEDFDFPSEDWMGPRSLFYITHKRFWHLNHYIQDSHIGDDIILPEEFGEASESYFECSLRREEAEKLLTNFGFQKLDSFIGAGQFVHIIDIADAKERYSRWSISCDTEDIFNLLREESLKKGEFSNRAPVAFDSLESYFEWIRQFCEPKGLIFVVNNTYAVTSGGGAILEKSVYDSLPMEPDDE